MERECRTCDQFHSLDEITCVVPVLMVVFPWTLIISNSNHFERCSNCRPVQGTPVKICGLPPRHILAGATAASDLGAPSLFVPQQGGALPQISPSKNWKLMTQHNIQPTALQVQTPFFPLTALHYLSSQLEPPSGQTLFVIFGGCLLSKAKRRFCVCSRQQSSLPNSIPLQMQ